jgi:hypothetical protein
MSVRIDGLQVLAVTDTAFTQRFDGFIIRNGGGEYYIRSVAVGGS